MSKRIQMNCNLFRYTCNVYCFVFAVVVVVFCIYSHITFCGVSSKQECLISSPLNWKSALQSQRKIKKTSENRMVRLFKTLNGKKRLVAITFVFVS